MQTAGVEIITIEVSLLIIVLLFFRHFFKDKLHPVVMKWLWGIPAMRILFPFQLPLDSLYGKSFDLGVETPMLVLWLLGMAAAALFFLLQNAEYKRNIKRHRTLYGRKEGLLVYFVDRQTGSCLAGLVSPRIYISRLAGENPDWCKWIVRHELCHYKSMDHWYAVLRLLCIVLQWFNPLVWYAAACSIEDLEIACDYRVIQNEEPDAQTEYGKCLIAMAAKNPQNLLQSISTGNGLGKGSLRRRIERLGETDNTGRLSGMPIVFGMLLLLGLCLTVPNTRENTLLNLLAHMPYVEECILHYDLDQPSHENVSQMIELMEYRCRRVNLEDVRFLSPDSQSLFILLPLSGIFEADKQGIFHKAFEEKLSYVIFGEKLFLYSENTRLSLDVQPDLFSVEACGEGYQLWLDLEPFVRNNSESFPEGPDRWEEGWELYLGQEAVCALTKENVREYKVMVYEDMAFENIYDRMEGLCKQNPCELKLIE